MVIEEDKVLEDARSLAVAFRNLWMLATVESMAPGKKTEYVVADAKKLIKRAIEDAEEERVRFLIDNNVMETLIPPTVVPSSTQESAFDAMKRKQMENDNAEHEMDKGQG